MKKYLHNFRNVIRFITSIFASREFALIYCVVGTIGQVAHTYFLTSSISSLDGNWRIVQALLLSIFISSSLLYFTAISDNEDTKESKRIHFAVTLFTVIEILINIYYYSRHLIIDNIKTQWFDFIFALLISCLIPITIKLYSSHIRAKEWFDEFDDNKKPESIIDNEELVNFFSTAEERNNEILKQIDDVRESMKESNIDNITELIQQLIKDFEIESKNNKEKMLEFEEKINVNEMVNVEEKISDIFNKNQDMFLKQFENKLKLAVNKTQI